MAKTILFLGIFSLVFISAFGQQKADEIVGIWETPGEDNGRIEIYKNGNKYHGRIVWLKKPIENGKYRVDENNPDPGLRSNPVVGLDILKGFVFDGEDEWNDGKIYDPANGKTYSCFMELDAPDKLKVRGFIGFSLLGRTEYWSRVQ